MKAKKQFIEKRWKWWSINEEIVCEKKKLILTNRITPTDPWISLQESFCRRTTQVIISHIISIFFHCYAAYVLRHLVRESPVIYVLKVVQLFLKCNLFKLYTSLVLIMLIMCIIWNTRNKMHRNRKLLYLICLSKFHILKTY